MIRNLKHKINRLKRNSKGVSTVIGTIFLVLIALTVATNVFLWTLTQNATYNQAVKESSQMEAERSSERIVAYDTEYSVPSEGAKVKVNTTITAQGALSAQIIRIWVTWSDGNTIKYGNETFENLNINSGQTITKEITVTVPGAYDGDNEFNGWFITARGNRVPLEQKELGSTVIVAHVAQGIGSVSMDFSDFRYYEVVGNVLQNYPQGDSAFHVETKIDAYLSVLLTNYDPEGRQLILYSSSLLWVYFPTQGTEIYWPISAIDYDTGVVSPYDDDNPIILDYEDSARIFFGSAKLPSSTTGESSAVNLILLGTIDGEEYGQNIPFVSISPE